METPYGWDISVDAMCLKIIHLSQTDPDAPFRWTWVCWRWAWWDSACPSTCSATAAASSASGTNRTKIPRSTSRSTRASLRPSSRPWVTGDVEEQRSSQAALQEAAEMEKSDTWISSDTHHHLHIPTSTSIGKHLWLNRTTHHCDTQFHPLQYYTLWETWHKTHVEEKNRQREVKKKTATDF